MPTRWPGTGYDDDTGSETYGFAAAADQLETFLSAGVAIGATTLNVSSTTGFPSRGPLIIKRLTAVDQSPEVCTYTGKTGTSFTGVSPTVRAWASGDRVRCGPVAVNHNDIAAAVLALEHRLKLDAPLSPAQITANQDNYNPTGLANTNLLRINSDAARTITGLATGAAERQIVIVNTGAFTITFSGESASSTAANRFIASIDLGAGAAALLTYDNTSSRWRFAGGLPLPHDHSAAAAGGATLSPSVLTAGNAAFGVINPAQITANTNDWNPTGLSTASVIRVNTDIARNLTGIAGGVSGRVLWLLNVGSELILKHYDAGSAVANRIVTDIVGADYVLVTNSAVMLVYDGPQALWRVVQSIPSITGWTEMGAAIADADEFTAYDASAARNRKVTATRLPTYVFSKFDGQLSFPATQNASAGANVLDDYEEGTWTPTLSATTTAGTHTYATQVGRYTKIGRMVSIEFDLYITSVGATISGTLFINGNPFANGNASATTALAVAGFHFFKQTTNGYEQLGAVVQAGQAVILPLASNNDNAGATFINQAWLGLSGTDDAGFGASGVFAV